MTTTKASSADKTLKSEIQSFINTYGPSALRKAMRLYTDQQQKYICKTKSYISTIKIGDIYYLKIQKHNITIYTRHGTYKKYGTLQRELDYLAPYGFIKCNQSCIVALNKIRTFQNNDILLTDGTRLYVSRTYAPKVLASYLSSQRQKPI